MSVTGCYLLYLCNFRHPSTSCAQHFLRNTKPLVDPEGTVLSEAMIFHNQTLFPAVVTFLLPSTLQDSTQMFPHGFMLIFLSELFDIFFSKILELLVEAKLIILSSVFQLTLVLFYLSYKNFINI